MFVWIMAMLMKGESFILQYEVGGNESAIATWIIRMSDFRLTGDFALLISSDASVLRLFTIAKFIYRNNFIHHPSHLKPHILRTTLTQSINFKNSSSQQILHLPADYFFSARGPIYTFPSLQPDPPHHNHQVRSSKISHRIIPNPWSRTTHHPRPQQNYHQTQPQNMCKRNERSM